MSTPEPLRVYHAGAVLRIGTPLLAVLTAAATTAGIQTALPVRGFWVPVVAGAGGVGIATLVLLWRRVTGARLEVFDGWFRFTDPDHVLIAHWADVVKVYSPTTRRRRHLGRHEYVVVLGGGARVRLGTEIGADADLGAEIDLRTRQTVADRTESHLATGREVDFGPITVSASGITVRSLGTRSIPFDRVRSHRLAGRHYLIRSLDRKGTTAVPVSRIPSAAALHQVVEQRMEMARIRPGHAGARP